ncbi:beta-hydroxyacyl-ACP dehydratase [Bacillus cereus]|uniref:3-hydroxyacyl-ACP dehydratase FabZ n=1 Tax=Bacillus cereus TaxID=1396 RepID=A0A2C2EIK3_BACCE|nr:MULTISPECIES: 3-hydroxyacyl-ACP dehydratase FabZ [Bacillus]EOQ22686.1 beta-hydroxyacyl-(acyl-carrier-protein) dehydratase FabZ [Bacillus cereus BAG3O-1]HDR8173756.1 3-hydroxyacyl-ACP dehydratase FabZ [Bacillus thuringiensis]OWT47660.1 beta-hydroxyacyl-ACP dehydratase [Bacillus sp. K2I17]PEC86554.1 beta-hydroxyacyl-ACP dehydratase [Bacillus cereus]PEQ53116.1 beta-hydroxyacyl-ACP dehydratase [Bacillus cereus]
MNFLTHEYVLDILPQRYPFLMVDKVFEFDGSKMICIKNVSGNEPCFQGHFPNKKIFPGVYVTEAMAQSAILLFAQLEGPSVETRNNIPLLYHTNIKFKKIIVPGDQLMISVSVVKKISNAAIVEATVKVNDIKCAYGELTFTLLGDE